MRKSFNLLIAFLAMVGLMIGLACSDDDNGTGPGDADIEALMQEQISQDFDAIIMSIIYGLDQFDGFEQPDAGDVFGKADATADPADSIDYQYTAEGWHVFYMEQDDQFTNQQLSIDYSLTLSDSVQFKEGETIIEEPDENTDYVHLIMWLEMLLDIQVADTSLSVDIDEYHIDCEYEKQPDDDILANGELDLDYTVTASQGTERGTGNVVYNLDVIDLELTEPDGCPVSGVITADLSIDFEGTAGEANGSWSLTATFLGNNQVRIQLNGPSVNLDYTETFECGHAVAASPIPFGAFIPSDR